MSTAAADGSACVTTMGGGRFRPRQRKRRWLLLLVAAVGIVHGFVANKCTEKYQWFGLRDSLELLLLF